MLLEQENLQKLFAEVEKNFKKNTFKEKKIFYFNIEGIEKSVIVDSSGFKVEDGKIVEVPDCQCEIKKELLEKIWYEDYKPSFIDFVSGKVRTNNPYLLREFMKAFGRKI
jgi:hypothetical protein